MYQLGASRGINKYCVTPQTVQQMHVTVFLGVWETQAKYSDAQIETLL